MTATKATPTPPYEHAGDIRPDTLPPDLDAAYRGAFWAARTANTILDHCRPSVAPYCDALTPLIFFLNEWLRPIGYDVRQVADEIALSRGTHKLVRIGGWTAATYHELALQHAGYVRGSLYRTLSKAARLPSACTAEPPYRELFAQHWRSIAPALAEVPSLGMEFQAALKLEALRTLALRQQVTGHTLGRDFCPWTGHGLHFFAPCMT
jgi:hypothetical protein